MKTADVPACIELLAEHPDFRKLYAGARDRLCATLEKALQSAGFLAFWFETAVANRPQPLGVGAVAFLADDFVHRAKQPPFFWIGPALVHDLLDGPSPIVSDDELLRSGALEGLTVFAWPLGFRPDYLLLPEVQNFLIASFMDEIRGYNLKEFLGQTTDLTGARVSLHSGAVLLTPDGVFTQLPPDADPHLLQQPHLFVISRQNALEKVGSWSSSLFIYSPPVLGFSRSEQRLLGAALRGLDDHELVSDLQVSLSAIKKTWRSIYSRVERSNLSILPSDVPHHVSGDRGKGKKHRLLNYVREHPEELRPISTKLLAHNHRDFPHSSNSAPSHGRGVVRKPSL